VRTVKNHVCEAFKKRLGNLICKLNQEKDIKSVQSTTSNTT